MRKKKSLIIIRTSSNFEIRPFLDFFVICVAINNAGRAGRLKKLVKWKVVEEAVHYRLNLTISSSTSAFVTDVMDANFIPPPTCCTCTTHWAIMFPNVAFKTFVHMTPNLIYQVPILTSKTKSYFISYQKSTKDALFISSYW